MVKRTEYDRYDCQLELTSSPPGQRLRLKRYRARLEPRLHLQLDPFPQKLRKSAPMTLNSTYGSLRDTYSGH